MKKTVLLLLLGNFAIFLQAQNPKADSLSALLKTVQDTTRVNVLNELCKSIWYYQFDRAKRLNQEAMDLAMTLSYSRGLAEAYRCRGVLFSPVFRPDTTGKPYSLKALKLFYQLNDKRGQAATLNNLGVVYLHQRQYSKALEVLQQALTLFTELKNMEAVGSVINQMGNTYATLTDYATGLHHYLKALEIRMSIGDQPGTAFSLTRVGDMYFKLQRLTEALSYYRAAHVIAKTTGRYQNIIGTAFSIGAVYQQQGKFKEALSYYKTGLTAAETFYGKDSTAWAYQRIGGLYQAQKAFGQALSNYEKALSIASQNDPAAVASIRLQIGQVHLLQNRYAMAEQNLLRSLALARQHGLTWVLRDANLGLSSLYTKIYDYKRAYAHHLQYSAAKDSLLNEDLNKKLAALEQSLELKGKQSQIDLLTRDKQLQQSEINRQKQQRLTFAVAFGLVLVVFVVLVRSNSQKQRAKAKIERAYGELKATQTQLIYREKMASLGELTAGIAHEIQNPLNFVNNFSEISKEQVVELKQEVVKGNRENATALADDVVSNLDKVVQHGRRADAIVKGMLQHARASTGEKQATNINQLVDEYLRLSYQGMRTKDKAFSVRIETRFDETVRALNVVPQDIGRVLLNLFNNAFYTLQEKKTKLNGTFEPTVFVSTKKEAEHVMITVKDNGAGMPPNVAEKVFQPFFTTKPAGEGTGLGLSLSYDIITKGHGGEMRVESKEGEGAEFTIQIPVAKITC